MNNQQITVCSNTIPKSFGKNKSVSWSVNNREFVSRWFEGGRGLLGRSYLQQFLTLRLALGLLQVVGLVRRGHDTRLASRGRADLGRRQSHGSCERRWLGRLGRGRRRRRRRYYFLRGLDVEVRVHHVPVAPTLGYALAVLPDSGDGAAGEAKLTSYVALALAALDLLNDLHLLFDREREPLTTLCVRRAAKTFVIPVFFSQFFIYLFIFLVLSFFFFFYTLQVFYLCLNLYIFLCNTRVLW